jgi:hypothetical protein
MNSHSCICRSDIIGILIHISLRLCGFFYPGCQDSFYLNTTVYSVCSRDRQSRTGVCRRLSAPLAHALFTQLVQNVRAPTYRAGMRIDIGLCFTFLTEPEALGSLSATSFLCLAIFNRSPPLAFAQEPSSKRNRKIVPSYTQCGSPSWPMLS